MRVTQLFKIVPCRDIAEKAVRQHCLNESLSSKGERMAKKLESLYLAEAEKVAEGAYYGPDVKGSVLLVFKDSDGYYDASRMKEEDFEDIKKIDPDDPHAFRNPMVSVLFGERKDVYNSEVSDISLQKYPQDEVAACLLRQMCFFGIDEETYVQNRDAEIKELEKALDQADKQKGIPAEDLFERLGYKDTRTKEEKEAAHREMMQKIKNDIRNEILLMQETVKHYQ